jgi:hypothetical protein
MTSRTSKVQESDRQRVDASDGENTSEAESAGSSPSESESAYEDDGQDHDKSDDDIDAAHDDEETASVGNEAENCMLEEDEFIDLGAQLAGTTRDGLEEWFSVMGEEVDDGAVVDEQTQRNDEATIRGIMQSMVLTDKNGAPQKTKLRDRVFDHAHVKTTIHSVPEYVNAAHLHALCQVILKDELEMYTTLGNTKSHAYLGVVGRQILCSSSPSILYAALRGDLAKAYCTDRATREDLDKLLYQQGHQAGIYVQLFCDDHGNCPVEQEWELVFGDVGKYGEGSNWQLNLAMDRIMFPHATNMQKAKNGFRKYAEGKNHHHVRNVIRTFVKQARNNIRTKSYPPIQGISFTEVGYARNVPERLKQHRGHQSSNLLQNLCEAALRKNFGEKYKLRQFVVYQVWSAQQAVVAEILWSRLLQSYTYTGTGFNAYPAGRSNASATRVGKETWLLLAERAIQESPLLANFKKTKKDIEDEKEDLEMLVEIHGLSRVTNQVRQERMGLRESEQGRRLQKQLVEENFWPDEAECWVQERLNGKQYEIDMEDDVVYTYMLCAHNRSSTREQKK